MSYPSKRRRTATSVLAGVFDERPARDVLTSLLNGVPMPKQTEEEIQVRREKKRERKEKREREQEREKEKQEKKRVKAAAKVAEKPAPPVASSSNATPAAIAPKHASVPVPRAQASSFWQARPQIVIPSLQRSASFSPPPMPSPPTTPGPSISSRTSATSSKRPYTPDDGDDLTDRGQSGWKGWVEGSPPPSEKLINLDRIQVLPERKTRSGKSFDAVAAGREGWV
ncbi:hypothetical protein C8T65DRAFT_632651 [Cerioporus squamosus]|nr:hypothetical protein C8T65DRAFT_632651 [Cerioporus squamosus]